MKLQKENTNVIILSLFEMVVGVLLLINPLGFTMGIITAAGILILMNGILAIIRYFRMNPKEASVSQALLKGLVYLTTGAFCIFKSTWFAAVFPLFTMVYGIVIFLTGLSKIQWTVDMLRMKKPKWYLPAIGAILSIFLSAIILSDPFGSTAVLWTFTAVSLILEAVYDIAILIVTGSGKKSAPDKG